MKLPAVATPTAAAAVAVGLVLAGLAWYVWRRGGLAGAGAGAGAAAVQLAGGVVSGAVGAVGASVGLPSPDDTVTDERHARHLIDSVGWFEASKWAGLPALLAAGGMPAGSGTPPPPLSPAGRMLAALQAAPRRAAPGGGAVADSFDLFSDIQPGA